MSIHFFTEDIKYQVKHKSILKKWLKEAIKAHHYLLQELNVILCSDDYLYEMNIKYLDHDTLTDVITFDNSDKEQTVEGDIFISLDRIKENAQNLNIPFEKELHRVIIHGTLHLLGFKDKTSQDQEIMRKIEDFWLEKLVLD
ncbi:rRNA maturation RNase YbeY [Thermoflexibacter ruber]|uniref:Endoribonuclease YbeY n=1 Tax=Thermoflexibacter ruber TaxID=1003 RepID=A0A1I2FGL4_9BACT|nr:rRNA maturation RNase YbeY [Thermoflexibacter ruber]SFF03611.1 rRNA maturation RNase YbeY [Thermoflexibacter ruber]